MLVLLRFIYRESSSSISHILLSFLHSFIPNRLLPRHFIPLPLSPLSRLNKRNSLSFRTTELQHPFKLFLCHPISFHHIPYLTSSSPRLFLLSFQLKPNNDILSAHTHFLICIVRSTEGRIHYIPLLLLILVVKLKARHRLYLYKLANKINSLTL